MEDTPPSDFNRATDWLIARHQWAYDLVVEYDRLAGDKEPGERWPQRVRRGLDEYDEWKERMDAFGRTWPAPAEDGPEAKAWEAAMPEQSPPAFSMDMLGSDARRTMRLLATLDHWERPRRGWHIEDLSRTGRASAALFDDWVLVVQSTRRF